jgi:hypothetical protein
MKAIHTYDVIMSIILVMIDRFQSLDGFRGETTMSQHRFSAMFGNTSEPGQLRQPPAAFVPYPTGFFPDASQQWIYQQAYEQAQREVALMAQRRRICAFSVN